MIKRIFLLIFLLNLIFIKYLSATEFDELDKPPEGAHEGQIFLCSVFSLGWPISTLIDSEDAFLKNKTYTFENGITKAVEVSHQTYNIGLSFEYMPIQHLGAALKMRRTNLFQNTTFGPEYENWKGYLYRDYTIFIGPALHATNRKIYDFILTPLIGYSFSTYYPTPVAKKILTDTSGGPKSKANGLSLGAEINCTIYFTGGLYVSIGGEWIRNMLNIKTDYSQSNPQYNINRKAVIDTPAVIIGIGYAFSN